MRRAFAMAALAVLQNELFRAMRIYEKQTGQAYL